MDRIGHHIKFSSIMKCVQFLVTYSWSLDKYSSMQKTVANSHSAPKMRNITTSTEFNTHDMTNLLTVQLCYANDHSQTCCTQTKNNTFNCTSLRVQIRNLKYNIYTHVHNIWVHLDSHCTALRCMCRTECL